MSVRVQGSAPARAAAARYARAARSTGALTAAAVVSAVVGLVPQLIVTTRFGLGATSDAYFMALAITLTLTKVLEVHTLPKLYITVLAPHLDRPRDLGRVVSNLLHVSLAAGVVVTAGLYALCHLLVGVFAPGFTAETQDLTTAMLRALVLMPLLSALAALPMAVLHSMQRFGLASAMQVVPGVFLVVFALATVDQLGIMSLVLGTVIGQALHVGLLYLAMRGVGVRHRLVFAPRADEVRLTSRMVLPFFVGSSVAQSGQVVDGVIASFLGGGVLSTLALAKKFRSYMLRFLLETLPTVMYPAMARHAATASAQDIARLLREGARMMHFAVLPALALVALLSDEVVRLVFQRGAFGPDDTRNVAACVAIMALGLLPGCLSVLFSRALFALQETVSINRTKVVTELVGAALTLVMAWTFGLFGLALGMAAQTLLNATQYYARLRHLLPVRQVVFDRPFLRVLALSALAAAAGAGVDRGLDAVWAPASAWIEAGHLVLIAAATVAVYLAGAWIARLDELRVVLSVTRTLAHRGTA